MEKGEPVAVRLPEQDGGRCFSILPPAELSDEGLLQYLDAKYTGVSLEEFYLPLEGELAYGELPEEITRQNRKYGFFEGELPPYSALLLPLERPRNQESEYWTVKLLNPSGNQYSLTFRAAGGELAGWMRYPEGMFTDPDFDLTQSEPAEPERGSDELSAVAEAYVVEQVGLCTREEINFIRAGEEKDTLFFGQGYQLSVVLKDGTSIELTVLKGDCTIQSLSIHR